MGAILSAPKLQTPMGHFFEPAMAQLMRQGSRFVVSAGRLRLLPVMTALTAFETGS